MANAALLHGCRGHGRDAQPRARQPNPVTATQARLSRGHPQPNSNFYHVDGVDSPAPWHRCAIAWRLSPCAGQVTSGPRRMQWKPIGLMPLSTACASRAALGPRSGPALRVEGSMSCVRDSFLVFAGEAYRPVPRRDTPRPGQALHRRPGRSGRQQEALPTLDTVA
jgi:hypothetical protein